MYIHERLNSTVGFSLCCVCVGQYLPAVGFGKLLGVYRVI